jgi:hypothetical protein
LPSPKAGAVALAVIGVALAIGNSYETLRRSTIPLAIEGRVESVEVRREKEPGVDDVHLLFVDGETFHVDADVARAVDRGAELHKESWTSTLRTDQVSHRLSPSRDAKGMFIVMPVVLLVLGILLLTAVRRTPRAP